MPCYYPITAYRTPRVVDSISGKPKLFFKEHKVKPYPGYEVLQVPCGQCIGCRLERSRQWAIRCVHEASLHEDNCFITLTYDNDHLPKDGSLNKSHFRNFMKRFRMIVGMGKEAGIRFFHCGEYGDQFSRPHYHACIFGWDFPDKEFFTKRDGFSLYISGMLQALWSDEKGVPLGWSTVGACNFETAAYVARYCLKKVNGENAEGWYDGRSPEYVTMSRRPGIGKGWFECYTKDVFPCDEVILRGKKMRPPKFYDRCFEVDNKDDFLKIKEKRKSKALELKDDNTPERLKVKEICKKAQIAFLKRGIEKSI